MGKKRSQVEESDSSAEEQEQLDSVSNDDDDNVSVDSDEQIVQREKNEEEDLEEKFGLKAINDEEGLLKRLHEVQLNFYNRMESKRLVKKQGKVPFTEHMTVSGETEVAIPDQLEVNNDIKREVGFYNATRENVMKGMQFLVQSKVPISRPDDFLAEMLKSDQHMANVKSRLLKQQVKIKTFEEKKARTENQKFHKALKDFKMKAKHAEKRENMARIGELKQRIREKGDDMADDDFDKVMGGKKPMAGRKGTRLGGKPSTIDTVREKERMRNRKKNEFKSGKGGGKAGKGGKAGGKAGGKGKGKRPGKNARGKRGKRR